MELDIEKLHDIESAVFSLQANGLETIGPGPRYEPAGFGGTFYQKENGVYSADKRAIEIINNNIVVLDAGIDYILSHVSDDTEYRAKALEYLEHVFHCSKQKSIQGSPLSLGHKQFSSAFGAKAYEDETLVFDANMVVFQGLSNILRMNLLKALRDLTVRKTYSLVFLAHSQVVSAIALDFNNFKTQFDIDVRGLYDRHGWYNLVDLQLDTEETACELHNDGGIRMHIARPDTVSLFNADILCSNLRFNNKKVLIAGIEEVSAEEIAGAAKKIKTVTDLNGVRMYRITKGLVIKNSQEVNDYWRWRRKDREQQEKSVGTLENHYIAVMDTPENSFKTIGTTLGRTISSCSRQLTNKVMASLDLDDLI